MAEVVPPFAAYLKQLLIRVRVSAFFPIENALEIQLEQKTKFNRNHFVFPLDVQNWHKHSIDTFTMCWLVIFVTQSTNQILANKTVNSLFSHYFVADNTFNPFCVFDRRITFDQVVLMDRVLTVTFNKLLYIIFQS